MSPWTTTVIKHPFQSHQRIVCDVDSCWIPYPRALILCIFSSVNALRLLAGVLFRNDPVDLTLLISSWMPVLGIHDEIFSDTF
jgi:hypothetical protein